MKSPPKCASARSLIVLSLGVGLSGFNPLAFAGGSAVTGKLAFEQDCSVCHSVTPGKVKVGPSLAGVIGRVAGSAAGYRYSDAMKASSVTWTAATLNTYLTGPTKMIPNVKMSFPGEPDQGTRQALIEYLESVSPPTMNAASK